ncbi:hypothetical protein NNJEOMEG_03557 [Fundidesulfovibrio magnetotacticus]|uniref:Uncharacterized protein n=1 Tax=Fundidesulfovibrio magnetotacticus TaxID=2730080 RepID=A0A6V8M0A1_9BACT|nr:hypothetical protein [Fundidesulfovibrio magnetotacticus]GFK95689.1 hypothetical protein NNJEOMEG_03557 [Fundidesulfovibrio magnetotacticus]
MNALREIAWDGLGLTVPAAWEPARVGLGYLRLEDGSGPRLTLRWQPLRPGAVPEKALKRLARRGVLAREERPAGVLEASLRAMGEGAWAWACRTGSGRGPDAVFFAPPGAGLAVLAAPHAREGEPALPWTQALASVKGLPPGTFRLYDVAGEAPAGLRLKAFDLKLGHYRLAFAGRGETVEFHRFAPAEAILRGQSLDGWAGKVLSQTFGGRGGFRPGYLEGSPAAFWSEAAPGVFTRLAGPLLARCFEAARPVSGVVWRADRSRILALAARTRRGMTREELEEVCGRYVALET